MNWIKDIDIEDLLTNDSQLIYEHCGMDVLIKLWECIPGLNLYISTKPLVEAKKRYIRKFYNGANAKQLAIKLDVSERFVYEALQQTDAKDERQGKLI
jgi:Mor family transcriptional regulator